LTAPSQESRDRRPPDTSAGGIGTDDAEVEASAAERVIFFSDAVIAIAITLLALALPVPNTTDSTTNGQLLHALREQRGEYLAFLISFLVIGNHWAAHRRMFRYVNKLNGQVSRLNMLWLLMMILTPFAARMLSGHGGFGVRFTLYALIQVIAAICLMQMKGEFGRGGLLRPDAPDSVRHPDNLPLLTVIVMFLVSIPVAFVSSWAFALWAAVPLVSRRLRQLMGRGRHAMSDVGPGPFGRKTGWLGIRQDQLVLECTEDVQAGRRGPAWTS
jgi:uncharacterized membrane protein